MKSSSDNANNDSGEGDHASAGASSPARKGKGKVFLWLVLVLLAGAIVWRLAHLHSSAEQPGSRHGAGVNGAVPVTLQSVTTEDFPVYLDGLGTVQAYNSVLVNARVSGLIQEIRFQEGQEVKQGDVLAVIDPRTFQAQYDQAVSKISQDTAQLESAKILLARDQDLLNKNVLDRQTYDTQKYLVAQLQATVQADLANAEMQKSQLDWTQVTAPISGRTGVKQVDVGNQVTVGGNSANGAAAIVTINQIQPIFVAFTLPQQDLDQIREPLLAHKTLEVVALDRNNRTVLSRGKLSVVDNQIDTSTATVKLKAVFANDDYKLWPGQFVNVRLLVTLLPDSVVVPSQAVQLGPDGPYVYVVGADHKAVLRNITTGATEDGMTLVKSGIKAGEMVVTDGQYRLQPGSEVAATSRKNSGSDPAPRKSP
jgi:multidrug efflux system membrane fusion protein